MLYLWLAAYAIELLLFVTPMLWRYRRIALVPIIALQGLAIGSMISWLDTGYVALFFTLSLFRIGNLLRIAEGRMHARYLQRATSRTALYLMAYHMILLFWIKGGPDVDSRTVIAILLSGQCAAALGLLFITLNNIRRTRYVHPQKYLSDAELPTLTVAIPARNETQDLIECLETVLASDYPKLEIIVLDDCSYRKTGDIIKSFAHKGVRFIQGTEPDDRWLAKNQAYERLYQESSGDIVLFCGVDVRFGPQTFRSLVQYMHFRKKRMISVMPLRMQRDPSHAIIQPMRYWWELSLPRILFNRPPVLSTVWAIRRQTLKKLGGFAAVSHTIIPEGFFARELIRGNAYSFLRANPEVSVRTVKSLDEQRQTAIRMRYPQIRRRPELVVLITLFELAVMLLPFGLIAGNLLWSLGWLELLPIIAGLGLLVTHAAIVYVSNAQNVFTSLLTFPSAVMTELWLGYESMLKYEFSEVDWKGRNICQPVMHAIPHLPPLGNVKHAAHVYESPGTKIYTKHR